MNQNSPKRLDSYRSDVYHGINDQFAFPKGKVVSEDNLKPPTPRFVATSSSPLNYRAYPVSTGSILGVLSKRTFPHLSHFGLKRSDDQLAFRVRLFIT